MSSSSGLLKLRSRFTRAGKLDDARRAYEAVLGVAPDEKVALNNLAALLLAEREFDRACQLLERLASIEPFNAAWRVNLGHALLLAGRAREAVSALEIAAVRMGGVKSRPEAMNNLCDLLIRAGRLDAAIAFLRERLGEDPNNVDLHYKLGYALMLDDALDPARRELDEAARLMPGYAPTFLNLATLAYWQHDAVRAEALLRHALLLVPDYAEAKENLGHVCLATGRYDEGWRLCEARTSRSAPARAAVKTPLPEWDGQAHERATLVVCPEQGLGDVIQFSRFLARARPRVGRIVFLLAGYWSSLRMLLASVDGVDEVTTSPARLEGYACSIASLPHLLGAGADVGSRPYLTVSAKSRARWRARLGARDALRVGVCWAGSSQLGAEHGRMTDRRRSILPDIFARHLQRQGRRVPQPRSSPAHHGIASSDRTRAGLVTRADRHARDRRLGRGVGSRHLRRYRGCSSRRCDGKAGMADEPLRYRLALGLRRRDHPVVRRDANFSPAALRRMATRHCGRRRASRGVRCARPRTSFRCLSCTIEKISEGRATQQVTVYVGAWATRVSCPGA